MASREALNKGKNIDFDNPMRKARTERAYHAYASFTDSLPAAGPWPLAASKYTVFEGS